MIQRVNKRWSHKSVRALIKSGGGRAPEEIVREKSRNTVERMRQLGWCGPPYDPVHLASLLGIRVQSAASLFSTEAQLTPVAGRQLLLEFNPERAIGRRNYSICHEIAHTFFDDCFEIVHFRKSDPDRYGPDSEVETLCQIAAAELLIPLDDFSADMKKLPFSLRSVRQLVGRYRASREAIMRRMVDTAEAQCAIVFFSKRLKPVEKRNRVPVKPKMRIVYSVPSHTFPLFLPSHKSVPDNSCVNRARIVDDVVDGTERWGLAGFGNWRVEAMALPVPDDCDESTPNVVAMLHVDP